jgi:hypothetical protein
MPACHHTQQARRALAHGRLATVTQFLNLRQLGLQRAQVDVQDAIGHKLLLCAHKQCNKLRTLRALHVT